MPNQHYCVVIESEPPAEQSGQGEQERPTLDWLDDLAIDFGDAHVAERVGKLPGMLDDILGLVQDLDLPADFAEQHDHYLYGTPKR